MAWTGAHRAFAVETFLKNGESIIATQRAFRTHFMLHRNDAVPDKKSILLWVENFRTTGSWNKRKPPGRPQSFRTLENIQTVRQSVVQSPTCSTRKHASTLGLSDRTVRRILHNDLKFHPSEKEMTSDEDDATEAKKLKEETKESPEESNASEESEDSEKKWNLKIASWNVNGIRAWLGKNGFDYMKKENLDIFCLQETKCSSEKVPKECKIDGYFDYWNSAETEGYSGTALYSKTKPLSVTNGIGIEKHDKEGRVLTAEYDNFYVVTAYIPNAGKKLVRLDYRSKEWDVDFLEYLKKLEDKKPVILCGDLNVAHKEIDLKNPKTNKKNAGFTIEERDGFTKILDSGFVDSYRHLYPDKEGAYTFWTYMMNARGKDVGWRLDYFVISEKLTEKLCDSLIHKTEMGSDHCPVVLLMNM